MDALLIRERYKVVRVLDAREDYAFVQAVDILDREQSTYLLNLYEGPLLRAYLPCFERTRSCAAFLEMFLEGDSLVTVFREFHGKPIDQVFFRGDGHDWRTRLDYAEMLLHQALNMADLPAELSCAAMLSENILVSEDDREINFRFKVAPVEGMNPRELVYLTGDQLRKILRPRFSTPREQMDFLDEATGGKYATIVQLYSLWRERKERIREACEKLEKKNFVSRLISLALGRIRRMLAGRDRGGKH